MIPKYDEFMLPLLKFLSDGKVHSFRECVDHLAKEFNLTDEERKKLVPSGNQPIYKNRIGWAGTYLRKAKLIESPKKGYVRITERGKKVLLENPEKINEKFLMRFDEFRKFIYISNKKTKNINMPEGSQGSRNKGKINWNNNLILENLYFENQDNLLSQISTALKSGKHIILVGPPGTGKSKLAKEICKSYNVEFKMVTAMSDWSTYDTIGGYKPKEDGTLEFVGGVVLKLLYSKYNEELYWLIIDEINRADIDKAFGSFLSVLTGDEVELS
ncbi:winged helix-turn-helix domain-containing protein [Thermosipho africanus]|uniref:winged helix-turn-helix domain-containing protein n=1 Tax=Thermosipho africanus TaxID=2421 RepID=UPI00030F5C8C|nr:winged helix-turn-helix domain-containing protein [Thermosipho africanus]